MKCLKSSTLGGVAILFMALLPNPAKASEEPSTGYEAPEISFAYNPLFDALLCGRDEERRVSTETEDDLRELMPSLQEAWAEVGSDLLQEVAEVVGMPFEFYEARANIFLCSGMPSLASPLIVSARSYVVAGPNQKTQPLSVLTNTLWHEVVHRFIRDIVGPAETATTPLLKKYADEKPVVRNHLHLIAIENQVYRRLGLGEHLQSVIAFDQSLRSAEAFAWAREIAEKEGDAAFVAELKQF
ncbi:MAG: hypothetical protein AAF830_13740 [Pseudomonadota bacterium]